MDWYAAGLVAIFAFIVGTITGYFGGRADEHDELVVRRRLAELSKPWERP